MSKTGQVRGVHRVIDKDIIKELTSKMKNVKAAGLSRLLSKTVKPTREARISII